MVHQPSSTADSNLPTHEDTGPTIRQDARQAVEKEWQSLGPEPEPETSAPPPTDIQLDGKSAASPTIRLDSLPTLEPTATLEPTEPYRPVPRDARQARRQAYAPIGY